MAMYRHTVLYFKGFAMKILQYEMKNKCLKVITKTERLILFTMNFYGTDVRFWCRVLAVFIFADRTEETQEPYWFYQ